MKQVTAQQFANIFGMWIAKYSDGIVYAYKNKPSFIADKMSWFENLGMCKGINMFVSDDDALDCSILIEPQEETASVDDLLLQEICSLKEQLKIVVYQLKKYNTEYKDCDYMHDIGTLDCQSFIETEEAVNEVPFDENYAPEGYKAVKCIDGVVCCPLCVFCDSGKCHVINCSKEERPDQTGVYFVKKEDD